MTELLNIKDFFTGARDTLDNHHDRRERIIKVSRDITAQSKKMIFALHRSVQKNDKTYKEANDKQNEIIQLFKKLSNDIQGLNYHRYSKSFSGAFEEFIEAVAFYHYLIHENIIQKDELDAYFKDQETNTQWLEVRSQDYLLGLADFTGEMMRYAITIVATGEYEKAMKICSILRTVDLSFDVIATAYLPILNKKMGALKSSIKKIEKACYTFQVRGSEYPKEMYLNIIRDHQESYDQD